MMGTWAILSATSPLAQAKKGGAPRGGVKVKKHGVVEVARKNGGNSIHFHAILEPNLVLYSQTKGVKRGSIYSLFHNKYLEDNKDNVHVQSLSRVQQCL